LLILPREAGEGDRACAVEGAAARSDCDSKPGRFESRTGSKTHHKNSEEGTKNMKARVLHRPGFSIAFFWQRVRGPGLDSWALLSRLSETLPGARQGSAYEVRWFHRSLRRNRLV